MIANISRVSGIAPDDLLRLDSRMFEAVEAEAERAEWGPLHELIATQAEIQHSIYRVLVQAVFRKDIDVFHVPRPGEDSSAAPKRRVNPNRVEVHPRDLAGALGLQEATA